LLPISENALDGGDLLFSLASLYAQVGELDKAVETFDYLLSIPAYQSVAYLRISPECKPLLDHSGFQLMLKKHEQSQTGDNL
jgi:hypothetical protein